MSVYRMGKYELEHALRKLGVLDSEVVSLTEKLLGSFVIYTKPDYKVDTSETHVSVPDADMYYSYAAINRHNGIWTSTRNEYEDDARTAVSELLALDAIIAHATSPDFAPKEAQSKSREFYALRFWDKHYNSLTPAERVAVDAYIDAEKA